MNKHLACNKCSVHGGFHYIIISSIIVLQEIVFNYILINLVKFMFLLNLLECY